MRISDWSSDVCSSDLTSNHWRATPLREVKPSLSPAHRLQETRPPSRLGSILSYRELPALAFPIPVRSRAMFRIMGSRPICNCAFRMFDKGTPIIEDVRIGICPSMGLETMNLRQIGRASCRERVCQYV